MQGLATAARQKNQVERGAKGKTLPERVYQDVFPGKKKQLPGG